MNEGKYLKKKITIEDLIMEYFRKNAGKDLEHGPVVDYVEARYLKLFDKKPRDTWRGIRKLHEKGVLIKVKKGVYKYDPKRINRKKLFEFSPEVKEEIFKRDGYKCVVCGKGKENGVEIQADHKKPMDKGGKNTLDNGQTLCAKHNFLKKTYSQTEFGKRFLIRLYRDAVKNNDKTMKKFCNEIFNVYDKYEVGTHIKRPK